MPFDQSAGALTLDPDEVETSPAAMSLDPSEVEDAPSQSVSSSAQPRLRHKLQMAAPGTKRISRIPRQGHR